jgi:uncharacterized protein (TIGR01777 family)
VKVVVSGGSGLLGTALRKGLTSDGHEVLSLVRRAPKGASEIRWDPAAGELDVAALAGVDAAVNLSGAGIGDRRWNPAYQQELLDSRTKTTRLLAESLAKVTPRPAVLLSGSAIGYYGDTGDTEVDENAGPGTGFMADLCVQWEAASAPASEAGIRVCHLRTGLVLAKDGPFLGKQLLLYKWGLGGPLGSGKQWQSWVAMADEIGAMQHLLATDSISGPVNLTGPEPVRQRDFAKALGAAVHRPAILPAPAFALRIGLGGFADEGILAGQRVLPKVLESSGYNFASRDVHSAIAAALAT